MLKDVVKIVGGATPFVGLLIWMSWPLPGPVDASWLVSPRVPLKLAALWLGVLAGGAWCFVVLVDLSWIVFGLEKKPEASDPARVARLSGWSTRAAGLTALWSALAYLWDLSRNLPSLSNIVHQMSPADGLSMLTVVVGGKLVLPLAGLVVCFVGLAVTWTLEWLWQRRRAGAVLAGNRPTDPPSAPSSPGTAVPGERHE